MWRASQESSICKQLVVDCFFFFFFFFLSSLYHRLSMHSDLVYIDFNISMPKVLIFISNTRWQADICAENGQIRSRIFFLILSVLFGTRFRVHELDFKFSCAVYELWKSCAIGSLLVHGRSPQLAWPWLLPKNNKILVDEVNLVYVRFGAAIF